VLLEAYHSNNGVERRLGKNKQWYWALCFLFLSSISSLGSEDSAGDVMDKVAAGLDRISTLRADFVIYTPNETVKGKYEEKGANEVVMTIDEKDGIRLPTPGKIEIRNGKLDITAAGVGVTHVNVSNGSLDDLLFMTPLQLINSVRKKGQFEFLYSSEPRDTQVWIVGDFQGKPERQVVFLVDIETHRVLQSKVVATLSANQSVNLTHEEFSNWRLIRGQKDGKEYWVPCVRCLHSYPGQRYSRTMYLSNVEINQTGDGQVKKQTEEEEQK